MKEINPSREMQDDRCDALVRTLTASSIESRAERRIESGKQRPPMQGFLTLDGLAVRLGRQGARQKGRKEKREERESHETVERERRGRCLPLKEAFSGFYI